MNKLEPSETAIINNVINKIKRDAYGEEEIRNSIILSVINKKLMPQLPTSQNLHKTKIYKKIKLSEREKNIINKIIPAEAKIEIKNLYIVYPEVRCEMCSSQGVILLLFTEKRCSTTKYEQNYQPLRRHTRKFKIDRRVYCLTCLKRLLEYFASRYQEMYK